MYITYVIRCCVDLACYEGAKLFVTRDYSHSRPISVIETCQHGDGDSCARLIYFL